MFASSEADGFNGFFKLQVNGETLRCIARDGYGWQHVSVSKPQNPRCPPRWDHMCAVKELFWGEDVWVVQFHPAKADYVNNHAGCLHLWRPTEQPLPTPPANLTGVKGRTPDQMRGMSRAAVLSEYLKANQP